MLMKEEVDRKGETPSHAEEGRNGREASWEGKKEAAD